MIVVLRVKIKASATKLVEILEVLSKRYVTLLNKSSNENFFMITLYLFIFYKPIRAIILSKIIVKSALILRLLRIYFFKKEKFYYNLNGHSAFKAYVAICREEGEKIFEFFSKSIGKANTRHRHRDPSTNAKFVEIKQKRVSI
jgi:hypothetical protein